MNNQIAKMSTLNNNEIIYFCAVYKGIGSAKPHALSRARIHAMFGFDR